MLSSIQKYLRKDTDAAPLAVFRILFGLLMLVSLIRFYAKGWIEEFYIQPLFSFSYYGFEWIQPAGEYTYLIFLVCAVSSILIALGYKYRFSMLVFFLSFTWIELMDKTTYLNHYYFISVLSFLMIFLPAHVYFSVDAWQNKQKSAQRIPAWSIDSIKLLLGIVYFYAGLAKLNPDWLFEALPLKIWLAARQDIPLLGDLLTLKWAPYLFSWTGVFFDLSIPFLLWMKQTRRYAFVLVIIFHLFTALLFPIGMFPYIMIISTLIFFEAGFHHKILDSLSRMLTINKSIFDKGKTFSFSSEFVRKCSLAFVCVFFVIQLLFPFRHLLYPGNIFWNEEGYRFSWRVMLMEKAGTSSFRVQDSESKKTILVNNSEFLTSMQEKQMATQPDFILQYAHFLDDYYSFHGFQNPKIYVESYVTLNGKRSRLFINPEVDLTKINPSLKHKSWVLPFAKNDNRQ